MRTKLVMFIAFICCLTFLAAGFVNAQTHPKVERQTKETALLVDYVVAKKNLEDYTKIYFNLSEEQQAKDKDVYLKVLRDANKAADALLKELKVRR